jgi:hypothetical protein
MCEGEMTDNQPKTSVMEHLENLKSLGLSEEEAKEKIDSESCFYNDLLIINKLKSLAEEQERLSKRSD